MKYMERSQVLSVLRAARSESERDFIMILLAYRHGLRASEVCNLDTYNFADGFITVARLKGSLKTTQPLFTSDNPLLDERNAVTTYLKTVPKGGKLFGITRQHFHRLFRHYCELAGIPKHLAHPHVCKHSAAMHVIRKAGIENTRQFLGHKSLNSTGAYLRVSDQEASKAIAAAIG